VQSSVDSDSQCDRGCDHRSNVDGNSAPRNQAEDDADGHQIGQHRDQSGDGVSKHNHQHDRDDSEGQSKTANQAVEDGLLRFQEQRDHSRHDVAGTSVILQYALSDIIQIAGQVGVVIIGHDGDLARDAP